MPDIYGSHFEYGGIPSTNYNLIIASVETGRMNTLDGTISSVNIYNKLARKRYLIDDDTSGSPLTFDVEFVTEDGEVIDKDIRRSIEKWLFNRAGYRKLYFDMSDDCDRETFEIDGEDTKRLFLNCRFINPEKMYYNGGIVGYKATLESDCGMFLQDATTNEFELNHEGVDDTSTITVTVDSDMDDYIYPRVTIVMGTAGGSVTIVNESDDPARLTKFETLVASATVSMNGELNSVSGDMYSHFTRRNFVRLIDGDNTLVITGDVESISFEYNNRRNL